MGKNHSQQNKKFSKCIVKALSTNLEEARRSAVEQLHIERGKMKSRYDINSEIYALKLELYKIRSKTPTLSDVLKAKELELGTNIKQKRVRQSYEMTEQERKSQKRLEKIRKQQERAAELMAKRRTPLLQRGTSFAGSTRLTPTYAQAAWLQPQQSQMLPISSAANVRDQRWDEWQQHTGRSLKNDVVKDNQLPHHLTSYVHLTAHLQRDAKQTSLTRPLTGGTVKSAISFGPTVITEFSTDVCTDSLRYSNSISQSKTDNISIISRNSGSKNSRPGNANPYLTDYQPDLKTIRRIDQIGKIAINLLSIKNNHKSVDFSRNVLFSA